MKEGGRERGKEGASCVLIYLRLRNGRAHVSGASGGVPVGENRVGVEAVVVDELREVIELVFHPLNVHADVADAGRGGGREGEREGGRDGGREDDVRRIRRVFLDLD